MFAAGLACFPQVKEDARSAADPVTRGEGRADPPQELRIFLGAMRERLLDHQ